MTTVSYAQNYEDVMLLRALRNIEHGFYVDVGAQDPIADSVTRLFYERGWRGINIDPVEYWYRRLCEDRPEDVNLNIAVGNDPGPLKLFEVLDSGLSTVDESFARRHEQAGFALRERLVPCRRLDSILDEYKPGTIHFLKIDCEGAERSVLESIDLGRWRPWIILLEATEPNSQVPTHGQWEGLLTSSGYVFAYADGLNRFYVANEKQDLLAAFLVPPNVFDGFVTRSESDAVRRVAYLDSELGQAVQRESDLGAKLFSLGSQLQFMEERLVRLSTELHEANATSAALRQSHEQVSRNLDAAHNEIRRLEDLNRRRVLVEAEMEERLVRLSAELYEANAAGAVLRQSHEQVSRNLDAAHNEIRRLEDLDRRRVFVEAELALIKKSTSWRLTAPLRRVRPVLARVRASARLHLARVARLLVRIRVLRFLASHTVGRFPKAKRYVIALLYGSVGTANDPVKMAQPTEAVDASLSAGLSRRAADALADLKRHCR